MCRRRHFGVRVRPCPHAADFLRPRSPDLVN